MIRTGDITDKIVITGIVDKTTEGTYVITYTVKDSSGNEATKKRTVKVKALNNPEPVNNIVPVNNIIPINNVVVNNTVNNV